MCVLALVTFLGYSLHFHNIKQYYYKTYTYNIIMKCISCVFKRNNVTYDLTTTTGIIYHMKICYI